MAEKTKPDLAFEESVEGIPMGIDEAGRGPLAGPVYAAAVAMALEDARTAIAGPWRDVADSKKLSPKKRASLAAIIKATPGCAWAVASASPREIDELNILRATHLAMRRAAETAAAALSAAPRITILVDGLPVKTLPFQSINIIKGDAKSLLVAAASILAKTARDADCDRLEAQYPGYGFAKHKGYPTAQHLEAIARLGPCPEHRFSFAPLKNLAAAATP